MCKLMLMFVLLQIFWTISGFEGTLFSEITFEAPIDDFSNKKIITYDMYTLTNNIHDLNYPTTINSHAFQLYFAPARIIHISTIYDFVISEDRHNSIVYSLNGINTTYLASIYRVHRQIVDLHKLNSKDNNFRINLNSKILVCIELNCYKKSLRKVPEQYQPSPMKHFVKKFVQQHSNCSYEVIYYFSRQLFQLFSNQSGKFLFSSNQHIQPLNCSQNFE